MKNIKNTLCHSFNQTCYQAKVSVFFLSKVFLHNFKGRFSRCSNLITEIFLLTLGEETIDGALSAECTLLRLIYLIKQKTMLIAIVVATPNCGS